ncbi:MAG: hypothetical protein OCD01_11405 [Fibrobacterales bacterium]
MMEQSQKYFHCYATANDSKYYFEDIKNLIRISEINHGVSHVELYIAISRVRDESFFDTFFMSTVRKIFEGHANYTLREIFFKDNVGRDFSSYAELLKRVLIQGDASDYVFIQNRSACGPYVEGWYAQFIHQYSKSDLVALCGSTINFLDHPHRSNREDLPHVQTYALLSQASHLEKIKDNFPGATETERLQIILNGEIGLSAFFLERGFSITCLEWPEKIVAQGDSAEIAADCKENVSENHPFYHRHYIRKNKTRKIKNSLFPSLLVYIKKAFLKPVEL